MNRIALWIAAACVMAATSAFAAAPDAASARAFIEKLYSHYPSNPNGMAFDPTGKNAADVFDPGMIAAFREDARLNKDEVGFVDADPICQCQDDAGLKAKIASVTMKGANAADVDVKLTYEGEPKPRTIIMHLVPVNGAWRIYDITTAEMKSYRADLLKANKEAAAQQHH